MNNIEQNYKSLKIVVILLKIIGILMVASGLLSLLSAFFIHDQWGISKSLPIFFIPIAIIGFLIFIMGNYLKELSKFAWFTSILLSMFFVPIALISSGIIEWLITIVSCTILYILLKNDVRMLFFKNGEKA